MFVLKTHSGAITVELDVEKAPISAANFLQNAQDGFYDCTIFHRVIDNFMIKGGRFDTDMQKNAGRDCIENEADNGLANLTGTLAMARTSDPQSASSQFFINISDNDFLNHRSKTD